jgi:hypothetical protein
MIVLVACAAGIISLYGLYNKLKLEIKLNKTIKPYRQVSKLSHVKGPSDINNPISCAKVSNNPLSEGIKKDSLSTVSRSSNP